MLGLRLATAVAASAAALVVAATAAAAGPVDHPFAPRAWSDPLEAVDDPLDLREVSFGQRDTELWLRVRTEGTWAAGALAEGALCVVLRRAGRVRRLCLGGDGRGGAVLREGARAVPGAAIVRRDERSAFVRFLPRAARLPFGRYRWEVASGADRSPDHGSRVVRIGALGQPRCFGAAARAAAGPCVDRALRSAVIPSPAAALVSPDALCERLPTRFAVARPCAFGYLAEQRPAEAALIGDSHSAHWRAAVDVVAQARGWRAVSVTHPGCALSTEVYPAPAPIPARCRRHTIEALRWLRAHPRVHTVFTSSSAGRGLGPGGFAAMWRRLPRTVRRIYVLREVPRVRISTRGCVTSVLRRRAPSARACAVPRGAALLADPSAQAARAVGGRVRLLDLTRHFCDAARCFPVVGGAYVYRDDNHMNTVFATTLGPFVLRRLG